MNGLTRSGLATLAIALPVLVGANAAAARSKDPFDQIPVGITTVLVGGGGAVGLAAAGLAALHAPWRGGAAIAAGIGAGLLASSAAGLAVGGALTSAG